MWGTIAAAVIGQAEQTHWEELLRNASPEVRAQLIADREKRQIEAVEERRHQELCSALRASRHDDPSHAFRTTPYAPDTGLSFLTGVVVGELLKP